jgi:hypothetical protein
MTRVAALLFMLSFAACSDQKSPPEAIKMIESPLQNTVISSGDHYPPEPVIITGSINAKSP